MTEVIGLLALALLPAVAWVNAKRHAVTPRKRLALLRREGSGDGAARSAATLVAAGRRRRRLASRTARRRAMRLSRQLPLTADLLAACLVAGASPSEAADAVGRSMPGPVGELLRTAAAELRLGGDPAACWARVAAHEGAGELGRCLERACGSGAPPAGSVARLAAECRADSARAAQRRARRAGVLATLPLGLCFLPAFLLVGVAPVVIGLAGRLLDQF